MYYTKQTYQPSGQRILRHIPTRVDVYSNAVTSGQEERDVTMIYPSGLVTAKVLPLGGDTYLKYTKHYYVGAERISSVTGIRSDMGLFFNGVYLHDFFPSSIRTMSNDIVIEAGDALEEVYSTFDMEYTVPEPETEGTILIPGHTHYIHSDNDMYFFHPDHLGSSSYITNSKGIVTQHMEYLPFGELLVDEHLNSHNSPFKFNAKELDPETGNYYYGARYYSQKYNLMLSVDPMYELYPSFSPYAYTLQNPIIHTDPTGMVVEPIYDTNGNHLGNTKEGFTGEVLIYDNAGGPLPDFENMTAGEAKQWGADTYDNQRSNLSGDAKSNIWTDVASKMEGMEIYDETFSMSDLEGGKIHFDSNIGGGWLSTYRLGTGKGKISGSDGYIYETTVENLQSSIGVHEYYSHIKKNNGSRTFSSHRLAYKNVINFKSLWNNTTNNYKEFNLWGLREYTWRETGRKTVDRPYLRLSNQYSKFKNKFK